MFCPLCPWMHWVLLPPLTRLTLQKPLRSLSSLNAILPDIIPTVVSQLGQPGGWKDLDSVSNLAVILAKRCHF